MEQTRKEYIESEFKKWEEQYEIGFEDEFDLKAIIALQYQYSVTPNEHVKTLGDIIHTKNQIMRNLNLKPKYSKSNRLFGDEIWLVDISYSNLKDKSYRLEFIKINLTNGRIIREVIEKLSERTFKDLGKIVINEILRYKPSKLVVDRIGIGKGLLDSVKDLIDLNGALMIKDNGDLVYKN